MARQIIVLERTEQGVGTVEVRAVFWTAVASDSRAPRPGFVSVVKGLDAPTGPETTALQEGSVIELVNHWRLPLSYSNAQIRAFLEVAFASAQAAVTATPPGQYYGAFWDGTAWGAGA